MSKLRVIVTANLEPGFVGDGSPSLDPLGAWSSVLESTLARVAAADLGPVTLAYATGEANRELAKRFPAVPGKLEHVESPMESRPSEFVLLALDRAGADTALLVDGRAAFISPHILRLQAAALEANPTAQAVVCPMAVAGASGLGIRREALQRLVVASQRPRIPDFDLDLYSYFHRVRWMFAPLDVDVDTKYQCVLSDLVIRRHEDARRLSAHALSATSEDYGFLADLAAIAWRHLDRPRKTSTGTRKILFFHYTTSRKPGSTTAFERMVDNWDRSRFDVTVSLPCHGELWKYFEGRFPLRELPISWNSADREASLERAPELEFDLCARFLESERPDVVFISGAAPQLSTAARLMGIPVIAYSHLPYFVNTGATQRESLVRAGLPSTDLVICASDYMRDRLAAVMRPPDARMRVVHCGIPLERFQPMPRDEARTTLNLPKDRPIVGIVGLLTAAKRPEMAIHAMVAVRKKVPNALLAIAGGERLAHGYVGKLQALVADLGLSDHVVLMGHVSAVHAVYSAVDLLAHLALEEPFAQVIPEAMAMERPVLAFRTGGPAEIILDGQTGRLLPPPGDSETVGEEIAILLGDPERIKAMGLAGRRRAEERFSAKRLAAHLEKICDELCSSST